MKNVIVCVWNEEKRREGSESEKTRVRKHIPHLLTLSLSTSEVVVHGCKVVMVFSAGVSIVTSSGVISENTLLSSSWIIRFLFFPFLFLLQSFFKVSKKS